MTRTSLKNLFKDEEMPKAYIVSDDDLIEVVYATSAGKAKSEALRRGRNLEDSYFVDLRARRLPSLDNFYPGYPVLDWEDNMSRMLMVRYANMKCAEDFPDCDSCGATGCCSRYKEEYCGGLY